MSGLETEGKFQILELREKGSQNHKMQEPHQKYYLDRSFVTCFPWIQIFRCRLGENSEIFKVLLKRLGQVHIIFHIIISFIICILSQSPAQQKQGKESYHPVQCKKWPSKKALKSTVVQYITEKSLKSLATQTYRKFHVSAKAVKKSCTINNLFHESKLMILE